MTILVTLHNHYDQDKLNVVIEQMRKLGPPKIHAFDLGFDGLVQAVEGTHRIRAAEILGLAPEIVYIDKELTIDKATEAYNLDLDFGCAEKIKEVGDWENYSISLDN